jgi:hypothetical protein
MKSSQWCFRWIYACEHFHYFQVCWEMLWRCLWNDDLRIFLWVLWEVSFHDMLEKICKEHDAKWCMSMWKHVCGNKCWTNDPWVA